MDVAHEQLCEISQVVQDAMDRLEQVFDPDGHLSADLDHLFDDLERVRDQMNTLRDQLAAAKE